MTSRIRITIALAFAVLTLGAVGTAGAMLGYTPQVGKADLIAASGGKWICGFFNWSDYCNYAGKTWDCSNPTLCVVAAT